MMIILLYARLRQMTTPAYLVAATARYLASRKQPNEVSPVWLFAKGTRSPVWRLDQRDRPPGKGLLGSAPVEVTVVACLGREGATSTRKLPTYSKPPSVEARCLACRTRQVGITGGKLQSCSFLSLACGQMWLRCMKGSPLLVERI